MIRNWYNQIPYPALKTKREITKYINWRQFTKGTRGKQNEQLFPKYWRYLKQDIKRSWCSLPRALTNLGTHLLSHAQLPIWHQDIRYLLIPVLRMVFINEYTDHFRQCSVKPFHLTIGLWVILGWFVSFLFAIICKAPGTNYFRTTYRNVEYYQQFLAHLSRQAHKLSL